MDHLHTAMQKGQAFRNLLIKDYFRLNISLDMLDNIYKICHMYNLISCGHHYIDVNKDGIFHH